MRTSKRITLRVLGARRALVLPAVLLSLSACGTDGAAEEVEGWYNPWFVQAAWDEPVPGALDLDPNRDPNRPALGDRGTAGGPVPAAMGPQGNHPEELSPEGPEPQLGDLVDPLPVEADSPDARRVTIQVKRGESLRLYSEWSGLTQEALREMNPELGRYLKANKKFVLELSPQAYRKFDDARANYYLDKEKKFFERYEVQHLAEYTVKKGDSIWKIAKSHDKIPIWVLERFNVNQNLGRLRPGNVIFIPVLNEIAAQGQKAGEALFKKTPIKPRSGKPVRGGDVATPDAGLPIRATRGESFRLYAKWSGLSIRKLRRANPGIRPGSLKAGQAVVIPIPDSSVTDFARKRREHHNPEAGRAAQAPSRRDDSRRDDSRRAAPREQAPGGAFKTYRVKRGDTAWKIAVKRFNIDMKALGEANPTVDLGRLRVGQKLRIPVSR